MNASKDSVGIGNKPVARVLQFMPGFHHGGVESLIMSIYRNLDKRLLQFDFVVDSLENLSEFNEICAAGGRVFQLGRYLASPINYQRQFNRILSLHNKEYIAFHGHDPVRSIPLLWASKRYGIGCRIIHAHTDKHQGSFRSLVEPVLKSIAVRSATHYWACSNAAGRFYFGSKNFFVLKNAIDAEKFRFSVEGRGQIRKRYRIGSEALVIGHTGRFTYPKNHEWIVRVFCKFQEVYDNSILLLVGGGPLESSIKKMVSSLGLQSKVIFTGVQQNVASFLSAMDVFFIPSHYEGFCISLLEAQANGLMCLASDVIHDEVRITSSVRELSLRKCEDEWSNALLRLHACGRVDSEEQIQRIRLAGLDVQQQAVNIAKIYLEDNLRHRLLHTHA